MLFAAAFLPCATSSASEPALREGDLAATGFENFSAGASVVGVDGWASTSSADESAVAAYGDGDRPSVEVYPQPYTGAGDNYLEVNSDGELTRALSTASTADVTYIDLLVKIPSSFSEPSQASLSGAKTAIWFSEVDGNVVLSVLGSKFTSWTSVSEYETEPAVYQFPLPDGVTATPGSWHRLTVESFASIAAPGSGIEIPAFDMQLDGKYLSGAENPYDAAAAGVASFVTTVDNLDDAFVHGVFVPALGFDGTRGSVLSVGFSGQGAVDDVVVTTNEPTQELPSETDFELSWNSALASVSYSTDGGVTWTAVADVSSGTQTIKVAPYSSVALKGTLGYVEKQVSVAEAPLADGSLALPEPGIGYYFDDTNGQDGSAANPFQIATVSDLKALQAAVASGYGLDNAYLQTADIALDAAWPGIGRQNGKDIYTTTTYDNEAFRGTYDGGNYTISNFQMVDGLDYCGFFNSVYNATIKNLKISYKDGSFAKDMVAANEACGATFVGVAKSSTLQNLTSLSGSVSCTKGFGGIVGFLMAGSTVDSCTNNVNLTSTASNKAGGIAMITQGGSGVAMITNCVNNGTTAGNANQKGGIVGYVGVATTIADCTDTAGSNPSFLHHQTGTLTLAGVNKAPAGVRSYTKNSTDIDGLQFATVDAGVATFVHNADLAAGNTYKVMATAATATYEFTAAGTISFDTSLFTPTYAVTAASGLALSSATDGTVTTYSARALATVTVTVTGGANASAAWTVNGSAVAEAPATLTEGDTYSVTYTANEGYEFADGATTSAEGTAGSENIAIAIDDAVASAPAVVEIAPETLGDATYASQAEAEAAAANVTVVPAAAVDAVLSAADKAAYVAMFEVKAVEVDGAWKLTAALTAAAETALTAEATADTADLVEAGFAGDVEIEATPGFYYSIVWGTALDSIETETARVLAENSTVTLAMPVNNADSGFYKVKVSVAPATVQNVDGGDTGIGGGTGGSTGGAR